MDENPALQTDFFESLRERVRVSMRSLLGARAQQVLAAEETGISMHTLKDWGAGRSIPPLDKYMLLTARLGVDPWRMLGAPASPADAPQAAPSVHVPMLDVDAAFGGGEISGFVDELEQVVLPEAWIRKWGGRPSATEALRVTDDSMSPTIDAKALILVDRSQTEVPLKRKGKSDDIFLMLQAGHLRVKRLRRLAHGFLALISDNARYDLEVQGGDDAAGVKVIGRVIWWDNRL